MIAEWEMKFIFNAAYRFMTGHLSCMQTQVRKSAPSRARSQGGRSLPQRRPPILPSSRCPVPAAATPPLNPGHPAPFSAKPFHQVQCTSPLPPNTKINLLQSVLFYFFSFVPSAFWHFVPSCLSALSCCWCTDVAFRVMSRFVGIHFWILLLLYVLYKFGPICYFLPFNYFLKKMKQSLLPKISAGSHFFFFFFRLLIFSRIHALVRVRVRVCVWVCMCFHTVCQAEVSILWQTIKE